jgi:3-hydroxyacyl-CoA dehydrogenase/enoyl-CoA hydratase/3-hydroxybutyryl-CoA epimerase
VTLLKQLDAIGIDVFYQVLQNLCKHCPKRFKMSTIIQQLYDLKCYGRKTKSGFCDYTTEGNQTGYSNTIKQYLDKVRNKSFQDNIIERIIFRMFNEATYLLEENIVDNEASIDFISIASLSFPPETGGLMNMFRYWKTSALLGRLKGLESKYGERFATCEWLKKRKGEKGEVKNDNLVLTPEIDLNVFPKPRNLRWIWLKYLFIAIMIGVLVLYYFLA